MPSIDWGQPALGSTVQKNKSYRLYFTSDTDIVDVEMWTNGNFYKTLVSNYAAQSGVRFVENQIVEHEVPSYAVNNGSDGKYKITLYIRYVGQSSDIEYTRSYPYNANEDTDNDDNGDDDSVDTGDGEDGGGGGDGYSVSWYNPNLQLSYNSKTNLIRVTWNPAVATDSAERVYYDAQWFAVVDGQQITKSISMMENTYSIEVEPIAYGVPITFYVEAWTYGEGSGVGSNMKWIKIERPPHYTVRLYINNEWQDCVIYYYNSNGEWIESVAYYYDGTEWKTCSF